MESTIEGVKPEVAEEAREPHVGAENESNEVNRKPEAGSDSMTDRLSNMSYDSGAGAPDPQPGPAPPPDNDIPVETPQDPHTQPATPGKPAEPSSNGKREGSRRVSFPEDGRIVSGYMDPPSPWNDGMSCRI